MTPMTPSPPPRNIHHTIDAREMAPPEPMVQTLDALETLPQGQQLVLLLNREPWPLYNLLQKDGYAWHCDFNPDGGFEILIWRPVS